jgi:hypothetical protein
VVVVAGRKPHVSNILGVSTGTLPVSVCLLPVPVSTLSCTPFHRSPTINSQRFALFDSTFSVRFKLISHSLSAPFPLPLRSADSEDVPTCLVCVCRRLPPSRSVAVCRPGGTPGSWVHFVSTGTVIFHLHALISSPSPRAAKRSAGREDGEVTEPPRGVGPEAGDNARVQRGGTAGRWGRGRGRGRRDRPRRRGRTTSACWRA